MSTSPGKRKVLMQRHVSSRMNFLYQAANLMAHSNNNTLAAYYGKLCRNVGTKALMHMSPGLKRTLCKRCSLPLLPGINSTLMLQQEKIEPRQQTSEQVESVKSGGKMNRKPRCRRMRRKRRQTQEVTKELSSIQQDAIIDEHTKLQLECSLCCTQRRFYVDTQKECWPERPESIVQVVTLEKQAEAKKFEVL